MYTLCKALLISAISSLILACGGGGTITSALPATEENSATILFPDDSPSDVAQSEVEQPEVEQPETAQATPAGTVASDGNTGDPELTANPEPESESTAVPEQASPDQTEQEVLVPEVRVQNEQFTPADITDLILVTGQSNTLGAQTAFDAALDSPHKQVFAFTDQGWQQADLHQVWDLGHFPRGNPGEEPNNNFALHMAKEVVRQQDGRVVGFVLATAPGQSITHWSAGGAFLQQIDSKVLQAINQLPHKSRLDGILWHQGESDAGDPDYHQKLDSLIENFRVQSWFASDRPFICGETAEFEEVNRQLSALNSNGDRWSGCVGSENLQTRSDGSHFNAEGLRELGRRYAVKYLQMLAN